MSAAILAAAVLAAAAPSDVLTGGDDALTQSLAEAVRSQLAATPPKRALTVTIPTHVDWRRVGDRTRVTYRAEFARGGARLGASRGTCWEDEIESCAKAIVRAASQL